MYGLRRIIQIDGFIPNKRTMVELEGHSIINGTNGAGKSSTLKLLSFFYGGDPSQLDSHAAGRDPFVQFYLPRPTSLLVFEYARESGLCCAVAYRHKSGTKHVYRFLEGGFSEERFSRYDASGKPVYCTGQDLKIHWQQLGLACSPQIEVVTDYRAIIQNDTALINRLTNSRGLRQLAASYCLGSRKTHMRYIERICAAIISRSGNMERMKDMLADIMIEDGVSFPETPVHRADAGLANDIASLREFEKEIPRIKEVLKRYNERLMVVHRLDGYGSQIRQTDLLLSGEIEQATSDLAKCDERLTAVQQQWEDTYKDLKRQSIDAKNHIQACETRITHLDEQNDLYDRKDMSQKASDFDNLGRYSEAEQYEQDRFNRLTEAVSEEENTLNRTLNSEHVRYDRVRQTAQSKLDSERESRRQRSAEYSSKREDLFIREKSEINNTYRASTPLKDELIAARATAQANAKSGGATEEERLSLAEFTSLSDGLGRNIQLQRHVLDEKMSVLDDIGAQRVSATEELNRAKHRLQGQLDELTALHKIAFAEDGTWLKRLRERSPNWTQTLGKVINPELLQRKDLCAEYSDDPMESIFGWTLNLNAIASPLYTETEEQLRADYRVREDAVSKAKEVVTACEARCEKVNKQFKDAELEVEAERLGLHQKEAQKKEADDASRNRQREINEAISERRALAKKEVERLDGEIKKFETELDSRIDGIKTLFAEELKELHAAWSMEENSIELELDRLAKDLESIHEEHKHKERQIREDFEQACSERGIDSSTLREARRALDAARAKVQAIRDSSSEVSAYRVWLATEWANRSALISEQNKHKAESHSLDNQLKTAEAEYKHRKREVEDDKRQRISKLNKLNGQKEQITILRPRLASHLNSETSAEDSPPFDLLVRTTQELLDTNDSLKEQIVTGMHAINSKIGQHADTQVGRAWEHARETRRQELKYDNPFDRNFLISLPQALETFLDDEIPSIKSHKVEALRVISKGLVDFFERLRVVHKSIESQSRRITSAIKENMKIDALSSIGILLTSRIDALDYWASLERFSTSWQEWRDSGSNDLPDADFLGEMSALIDALKSIKAGMHLRDYFDLHIRMTENGHERVIQNDYQLDNSTSDGLKYLALCVIFIAISRLLCPDKEVALHWPIDELGILHGENIAKLFGMLNEGGIVMVGGFPSEDPVMLRHFKHRQVIDFKNGIRVIDIPKSTLRERALASMNKEELSENPR